MSKIQSIFTSTFLLDGLTERESCDWKEDDSDWLMLLRNILAKAPHEDWIYINTSDFLRLLSFHVVCWMVNISLVYFYTVCYVDDGRLQAESRKWE